MRSDTFHDRPMGLFVLAGFVVLGVVVQIAVLPPKASASDARQSAKEISFADVEPLVVSDEPAPVVQVTDDAAGVELPVSVEALDVPPVPEPEVIEPVRQRTNESVMTDSPGRPEIPDDPEPLSADRVDVPIVPEPEAGPDTARSGYQVMGSVQGLSPGNNLAEPGEGFSEGLESPGQGEEPFLYQDDATLDGESLGPQLVLLGPPVAGEGDEFRFTITAENVEDLFHAPLRLSYDPLILEFVEAEEGDLLRLDGAATVFMASGGEEPGLVSIALSRMPPSKGANGSGVLCTVTFRAIAPGNSPMVLGGSRLLDDEAHDLDHEKTDSYVAIR